MGLEDDERLQLLEAAAAATSGNKQVGYGTADAMGPVAAAAAADSASSSQAPKTARK